MVYGSIWCFWSGILCFGLGCVFRLLEPCDGLLFISGKYAVNVLALVFIAFGAAGFFPNILVLLMDQLPDISSSRLRSCIHWFVWALYFGFFCENWMESASQLYPEYIDKWFYVSILVAFTIFSTILVLLFFFQHKFIISFARTNSPVAYHNGSPILCTLGISLRYIAPWMSFLYQWWNLLCLPNESFDLLSRPSISFFRGEAVLPLSTEMSDRFSCAGLQSSLSIYSKKRR